MRILSVLFLWLLCLTFCQGYRLLGVFPFHGKSHFVMFEHLMKGLARKGHQIDVISTFPQKTSYPNYTDIIKIKPPIQLMNNLTYELMQNLIAGNPVYAVATLGGNGICAYLGKPEIQNLIRNPPQDPPYDAVLIEMFGASCFAIFGHLWNIPIIGVSTTSLYPWLYHIVAYPESLAFVPNNCINFTPGRMNFWQRLYNTVFTQYIKVYFRYLIRVQNDIIREHLGPDMPKVEELERKIALILLNSHISLNGIRPTTPAVVDVAGLHVEDEGLTLQPDLEKWMNDSKDGFIYFTFGSMVMIETFPRQFLDVLYKSLSKISPIRVLMKIPSPEKLPAGLPENIHTRIWMPQIKVLQHPNIKAFITHGGLMGTQEAIACGVPMIGIPLFADQFTNIDLYVARNIAVKIDVNTVTEEDLDAALNAILQNPIYRETAKNISRRFLDRPQRSIDTANYWIEYVIKYGSDSLRSPALDFAWWQLELLDVIAFIFLCVASIIIAIIFFVRFILKLANGSDNSLYLKKAN